MTKRTAQALAEHLGRGGADGLGEGLLKPFLKMEVRHADGELAVVPDEFRPACEPQVEAWLPDALDNRLLQRRHDFAIAGRQGFPPAQSFCKGRCWLGRKRGCRGGREGSPIPHTRRKGDRSRNGRGATRANSERRRGEGMAAGGNSVSVSTAGKARRTGPSASTLPRGGETIRPPARGGTTRTRRPRRRRGWRRKSS